ncbi:hypothetical protein MLD38_031600 [Melastoma candidum]|uniref:Uncharacterized protein n=1 Tax=Melastoma candidum TaxID=119954 RepID=A0ACB9MQ74_9MYRT|nr:hypothetical protein MLD38_031600 [Melastoma candidum]
MSDWFTSKLRAAENILHKIDQQAAESLRKNEKGASDGVDLDLTGRAGLVTATSGVPLKEQFKKKAFDGNDHGPRVVSNLASDSNRDPTSKGVRSGSGSVTRSNSSSARNSDAAEGDWTELLGSPTSPATASPRTRGTGAGSRGGRNNSVTDFKRNPKMTTARMKAQKKLGPGVSGEAKVNGIEKNEGNPPRLSLEGAILLVDLQNPGNLGDNQALERKDSVKSVTERLVKDVDKGNVATLNFTDRRLEDESRSRNLNGSQGKASLSASNLVHDVDQRGLTRSSGASLLRDANAGNSVGSELGTDSGSSSDSRSEAERERGERRRRRQKLLAEKVAAKAAEYIKERENMVAKLEGEKQSLEKIVEERAKQQVKEASELQTIMMETLEAAELEKQKHNNTRMEAFARLAKLETTNVDLAKALAAAQGNLEVEVKRVADLRQQIELKEVAHGDLRRRITKTQERGTSKKQESTIKTLEVERELLEAECAFIADKIQILELKAQHLSENIELTRKEMEEPTEVEVELNRRLGQLTDHLIQKQAQVEALSSEKATLSFRIETVSRMLAEGKSTSGAEDFSSISLDDVESGKWDSHRLKLKPTLEDKLRSGKEQLWMLLLQLDTIFLAGSVYLRRYPPAKLCFFAYLACLHMWVIYIFKSDSRPSRSGAVISLENINGH